MKDTDYIFVKCFNEDACLQGDPDNKLANCAEGYDGVMCTTCKDFHWKDLGSFVCYPCAASST